MVSKSALNNMYRAYSAASKTLRDAGMGGAADRLFEDFGHELTAWDSWYDDGARPEERPDYAPTMANLNFELKRYGYRAVGGKNPRVVRLDPPKDCKTCGEEIGSEWATDDCA